MIDAEFFLAQFERIPEPKYLDPKFQQMAVKTKAIELVEDKRVLQEMERKVEEIKNGRRFPKVSLRNAIILALAESRIEEEKVGGLLVSRERLLQALYGAVDSAGANTLRAHLCLINGKGEAGACVTPQGAEGIGIGLGVKKVNIMPADFLLYYHIWKAGTAGISCPELEHIRRAAGNVEGREYVYEGVRNLRDHFSAHNIFMDIATRRSWIENGLNVSRYRLARRATIRR